VSCRRLPYVMSAVPLAGRASPLPSRALAENDASDDLGEEHEYEQDEDSFCEEDGFCDEDGLYFDAPTDRDLLDAGDELHGFTVGNSAADDLLRAAGYAVASYSSPAPLPPAQAQPAAEKSPVTGVSLPQQLEFARRGHVALRSLLPASQMRELALAVDAAFYASLLEAYRQKLDVLISAEAAESVSTPDEAQTMLDAAGHVVPFLQQFNLHRTCNEIAAVALNPRLGEIAADLLGIDSVRLYQTSVFAKRPGDGPNPWHTDLLMAPIDTNAFVTFFIPLRALPAGKHAPSLRFASGSHTDFAAAFWHGLRDNPDMDMSARYEEGTHGALAVGDATAHAGWTLHCSPGIRPDAKGRTALSISYCCADSTRVLPKAQQALIHTEDRRSYSLWIGNVKAGKLLKHELLPVVYRRAKCDVNERQAVQNVV
jgi:Phytanoyl-CoA dioxygenase (PhyH)